MEQNAESFDDINIKPHFMSLLTANYYLLHSFILTMVPNKTDAEDILQNTFMYLWEHFGDFRPGTSFISWATTIAKFQVMTYRKTKLRSKVHLSEEAMDLVAAESVKISAQMDERYEALEKCLKKLPEREFDFLKKRFIQGSSVKKIAQDIGASLNVVYKRIARLKGILLDCIRQILASKGVYDASI
jgi:RNA polymerase sigma-70 factor (ECF subfamily)